MTDHLAAEVQALVNGRLAEAYEQGRRAGHEEATRARRTEPQPEVTLPADDLKALFDLIVQSMDFGSGFLDGEDIVLLRRVADMIGVDPVQAIPFGEFGKYPHPWKPTYRSTDDEEPPCDHYGCRKPQSDPIHVAPQL